MEPFNEKLPTSVEATLASTLRAPAEEVLIHVATDMEEDRSFGERWVVVTDQRMLVIPNGGPDGVVEVPIEAVDAVHQDDLVGFGRLRIEKKNGEPILIPYSRSRIPRFAEVAEGLRELSKGEPPAIPSEVERTRCETCGRVLPEPDGICPACVQRLKTLGRVSSYLRPYKARVALLILGALATSALQLLPPLITRSIIDDVLTPRANIDLLYWLVAALFGVRLLMMGMDVGFRYMRTWVGSHAIADIRGDLYRQLQYLPVRFYDRRKLGSLISRMSNDADRLDGFLIYGLPFVFNYGLMVAGILALLLYMNAVLTLYILLPVPPIIVGSYFMFDRMRRFWGRWSTRWGRLSSHLNESITGIRVVKAFAQEDRENERFNERNDDLRAASVTAERNWLSFSIGTSFLMSFGAFFVWYFGGRQILEGDLTLGDLMAFVSYLWMLYGPLRGLSEMNNWMTRALAGAERIFEILDADPEEPDHPDAQPMTEVNGRVRVRNVSFGYDRAKPVLKEVNLDVEPGEMIGLVGRSGVGKSTLINLICRFYDPDRGSVEIDGVDIRKIRLKDLRRSIGMVQQDPFLFDGTILENIAYARPDASFEEILRASRAAEAHEFIVRKPDGYDMRVGEKGNKLSGGERQRLSIARAILHDPPILILDEATSSLDSATEKKIQTALARLVKGRTTFAIAHRLSTLRSADRLVVLDRHGIAEVGSHAELMERQGLFYRLVKTQQETSAVMAVGGGKE